MLKPGIILPPHPQKNLIRKLTDTGNLHWSVFSKNENWSSPSDSHFATYDSEVIPLISDVLFVLDPEFCQFEYLDYAVRNSCHLFIDTVERLTELQLNLLIELAHEAGTQITVRADQLYSPITQQLIQFNQFPRIIKGDYASARIDGDLFLHVTCFVRILLKLNPTEITDIAVAGGNFLSDLTDFIDIHLDFADGMTASLTFNKLTSTDTSRLTIYRNGGLIEANFDTKTLEVKPENQTLSFSESDENEKLISQMTDFLNHIENREFSSHSLEEEKEVFVLVNRIKEQLRIKSISI